MKIFSKITKLITKQKFITVSIRRTLYMESYIDYEKAK